MAAIKPDSVGTDSVGGFANQANGLKHIRLPFITQKVNAGDTFTLSDEGGEVIIAQSAWETGPTGAAASILSTDNQSVIFGSGVNADGYLHLWVTG